MNRSDATDKSQPGAQSTHAHTTGPALQVRLLGGFGLKNGQGQPLRLGTRKAEALLALLALHPGQPQARDKLCALLWPDVSDAQARHSLRQTLFHVRKVLATSLRALLSDTRGLQLSAASVDVDVARFEAGVVLGTRESLQQAWGCYRGDLLEGLCVDEEPFEHWLRGERERLRSRLSHALAQLVALDSAAERYADATRACARWVELDPLREDAHRNLMRLLAAQGRRTAALAHYHTLSHMLRAELDAEPDRLAQQLRAATEPTSPLSTAVTTGRSEALVALEQAYADSARLPQAERDRNQIAIVIRQAPCLVSLGRFAELLAHLRAHAARLEALDAAELAAPFHFFWAFALALLAERRDANAHAQLALSYAVRCGDLRVTGYTHALLSYLCQMTGWYRVGVRHGLRATELLERCHDAPEAAAIAWLSLGLNQLWLGDPRTALLASDRALAIARAADNVRGQVLATTAAGCIYAYTDEWERALDVTQRALETSKEPFTLVSSAWMAAWAYSGRGRTAEAIGLLTHVISQLEQHGMRAWSAHAMTILADAQLRAGSAAQALRVAREAREVANSTDDRTCVGWAMRLQGDAALALGELGQARECLDGSLQLFEALEAPIDVAKGLVSRAALGLAESLPDQARQDLQRARELYTACGVEAALDHVARLEARVTERFEAVLPLA